MRRNVSSPPRNLGLAALERKLRSQVAAAQFEPLENRRLLSASPADFGGGHRGGGHGGGGGFSTDATIAFSLAPTAVQSGLTSLASTAGDAAPTATTAVTLHNHDGVESYSIDESTTGVQSVLTVDVTGAAVTAASTTTTTFGAITDAAVTNELTAIASGLSLTAPTATTAVDVTTRLDGTLVYSVSLARSTTTATTTATTTSATPDVRISVDSAGNPTGHEQVPLGVLSAAVQAGLTAAAPASATALSATSLVQVETADGVTLYTATYSATGVQTRVTVDTTGALTSLPSTTQVDFSSIPAAASAELQTLATADGYTGTVPATQTVNAHTEATGLVIYTVTLSVTATSSTDGSGVITVSTDAAGNPTVLSSDGGRDGLGTGGDCAPPGAGTGSTTTGTAGTTSTGGTTASSGTATGTTKLPIGSGGATTAAAKRAVKLAAKQAAAAAKKAAKLAAAEKKAALKAAKLAARIA